MSESGRRAALIERLQAASVADAGSVEDLVALAVADVLPLVGADAGFVATPAVDGRTLCVARVTPYSRTPVRLTFPIDAPYPLAETMRTQRPLFIASNEQLACDHPGLVRVKDEDHACATLPLRDEDGRTLGALNLGYEEPHEFEESERELIELLGRHCERLLAQELGAPARS